MKQPFLIGDGFTLRPVEPADAPIVAACNNHPDIRATFFTHTPLSEEAASARIRGYYAPGADYIPLAICDAETDAAIGITALHRVDLVSRAAVYSICIADPAHWGRGLGRSVTEMMLRYAFDILNLHRIQLHVWTGNTRAVQSYEKCGFIKEGTLREAMKHQGEWCDFYVMGVLEGEWRGRSQ
ncbi:MAG: GNAT family protein [Sumerlaeia bacterium]